MRTHALRNRSLALILGGFLLLTAGCVGPIWVTEQAPQTAAKIGVTADLPAGWARYTPDQDLLMTRDGFILETIRVSRSAYGSKIEHTDRTITKGLDEQEAAQIVIDSYSADQSKHNLSVVDNKPVTIDGRPGFAIEVTYKTPEGLPLRETLYVALVDDSYVLARFIAPDRHYHELHRGAFETVVQSLKIGPMPGKKG